MRQMKLWMLATILTSCGLTALTSCSNEDNTIVTPTDETEAQLQRFIPEIRALKGSPLLCIDEEGGRVARIGRNSNFQVKTNESMGAITQQYTNGEAAVGCIKAGVDIVLGPQVFTEAFDAVVKAVEDGEIKEQRINESVRRILKMKQSVRQSL